MDNFRDMNTLYDVDENIRQVKNTIVDYMGTESTGVGLVTNDLQFWSDIKFPFPIIIKSYEILMKMTAVTSYIFDARSHLVNQTHLKLISRNADTKYVILTTTEYSDIVVESILNLSLCFALVVEMTNKNIKVFSLEDGCQGIGNSTFGTRGCRINISFMDFPPNIIFTGKYLSGFEGKMIETIAHKMGFVIESYINRHESDWGQFEPPSGLLGDVFTETSLLGIGSLSPFAWRLDYLDFIFPCHVAHLGWAVATGSGPTTPTWFLILVSEFSTNVWILISLTFLSLNAVTYFLKYKNKHHWFLHNLALILGSAQPSIQPKCISVFIIFFGLIITSYYQTMMATRLTLPQKIPEIDDLNTLSQSGLLFYGPPTAVEVMAASAAVSDKSSGKHIIKERFIPSSASFAELLPRIVDKQEIAFIRHKSNLIYHVERNPKYAGKVHLVKEDHISYPPATMFKKYSCLSGRIQKYYTRLCDSGLCRKWYRDVTFTPPQPADKGPTKLAFQHIKGFIILLAFGLSTSFVSFIAELLFYYLTKCCK